MTQDLLQQKLYGLNQENQQRFQKEYYEFATKTIYNGSLPEEKLFAHHRQFAFSHRNEVHLSISFKYWEYMAMGVITEYFIQDIATYLTAAQSITLVDYIRFHGQTPETFKQYKELRLSLEEMEAHINPLLDSKADEIIYKLQAIQKSIAKPGESGGMAGFNTGSYKKQIQL